MEAEIILLPYTDVFLICGIGGQSLFHIHVMKAE